MSRAAEYSPQDNAPTVGINDLAVYVPGQRLGFGAYGSGCSALFFSGRVGQEAEDLQGWG